MFHWAMIPYAIFMLLLMTLWLGLPCYVAWLWLAHEQGRPRRLVLIGAIYALFAPAAAGIWTWESLPGIALLGGTVSLMASTALLGGISLLMQRCFLDQAPGHNNPNIAPVINP